jgi:hypothetical protein
VDGLTPLPIQDGVGMSIKMIERYCRFADKKGDAMTTLITAAERKKDAGSLKSYSAEPKKLRKSNLQHYGPNTTACMMRPGSNVNTPAMTSAPMKRDTMASRCLRSA